MCAHDNQHELIVLYIINAYYMFTNKNVINGVDQSLNLHCKKKRTCSESKYIVHIY